ncbi:hypothetical protein HYX13_05605 [Candidatus Woesearchaeota archaeon]|nr:hypothetical protein [Candidatus Woesearchaeota archaeon]
MGEFTTIQVKSDVLELLQEAKEYPRQTYNEILEHITKIFLALKKRNQYDRFLHTIQQQKMKELWKNEEDEVWERV